MSKVHTFGCLSCLIPLAVMEEELDGIIVCPMCEATFEVITDENTDTLCLKSYSEDDVEDPLRN